MAMQLWIGGASFAAGAADVTSRTRIGERSVRDVPVSYITALDITVTMYGSTQAALSVLEAQLRSILTQTPRKDVTLRMTSGVPSSMALANARSISGVRLVSGPDFKKSQGSEFVNHRTASFTMEAEYPIVNTANAVLSWTETVSIVGNGGPDRKWRFPLNARPIRQTITEYSLVRATQTGQAVGWLKLPSAPLPLWPGLEVNPGHSVARDSPEPRGQGDVKYPVRWSYTFESGGPLVGLPSLAPV